MVLSLETYYVENLESREDTDSDRLSSRDSSSENIISMLDPSDLYRPENKEYAEFRQYTYDKVSLAKPLISL